MEVKIAFSEDAAADVVAMRYLSAQDDAQTAAKTMILRHMQQSAAIPRCTEAEKSVLGTILYEPGSYVEDLLGQLEEEDFFIVANREIFCAIKDVVGKGQPASAVNVQLRLRVRADRSPLSAPVMSPTYLLDLIEAQDALGFARNIEIIKLTSMQRKVQKTLREMICEVSRPQDDVDEMRAWLQERLRTVESLLA